MHKVLEAIIVELDAVASQVMATVPNDEPLNVIHGNWSFPGVTRIELANSASEIASIIKERGVDNLGVGELAITSYIPRLQFLRSNTVQQIWSNAGAAVPAYLITLQSLRKQLEPFLSPDTKEATSDAVRRAAAQVRAMEARIRELEPRSIDLEEMVDRIEKAYQTADQLPGDLEALEDARKQLNRLIESSLANEAKIKSSRERADDIEKTLHEASENAAVVLSKCESAYSAATSQGLARSFDERSKSLNRSMLLWVVGLVFALTIGALFGSYRLIELSKLINTPSATGSIITVNLILSILSVGAPVWFAWLATKQIGYRFQLSEDYAFKASVSKAYEGFRRETARFDNDMEENLLRSALARLDELPLRLVDNNSHGSPWHELMSSEVIKNAVRTVPGFVDHVYDLAKKSVTKKDVTDTVLPK